MEAIGREIERTDCCVGFMLVHSVCGGTGSGYGARITEQLKAQYPAMFLVNVAVLPFRTGENPIQSYNTVLAFQKFQECSDMVVVVENSLVAQDLASKQKVSMDHVNAKIVQDLQGVLADFKQIPSRCSMWEILRIVCAIPSIKLCSVGSHAGRNMTENVDHVSRAVRQRTGFGKFKSISGVILSSDSRLQLLDKRIEVKLTKSLNFASWNPFPVEFWCRQHKYHAVNFAMNNCSLVNPIVKEADNAMLKFNAGAYLHWFTKFGVEKDDFILAFESLDKLVEEYRYFCG